MAIPKKVSDCPACGHPVDLNGQTIDGDGSNEFYTVDAICPSCGVGVMATVEVKNMVTV